MANVSILGRKETESGGGTCKSIPRTQGCDDAPPAPARDALPRYTAPARPTTCSKSPSATQLCPVEGLKREPKLISS